MRALQNTLWEWMCFPHEEDGYFLLDVRRSMFLEDTFEQLAAADHRDYKRPLMVNTTMSDVKIIALSFTFSQAAWKKGECVFLVL